MTSQHDKAKRWRHVSIRGLLMWTMIAAIAAGWYVDRKRLNLQLETLRGELDSKQEELARRDRLESLRKLVHPGFQGRLLTNGEVETELVRVQAELDDATKRIKQLERK